MTIFNSRTVLVPLYTLNHSGRSQNYFNIQNRSEINNLCVVTSHYKVTEIGFLGLQFFMAQFLWVGRSAFIKKDGYFSFGWYKCNVNFHLKFEYSSIITWHCFNKRIFPTWLEIIKTVAAKLMYHYLSLMKLMQKTVPLSSKYPWEMSIQS